MDIYILKHNMTIGPYGEAQIHEMMASGILSKSELAWHQGLSAWVKLDTIIKDKEEGVVSPLSPSCFYTGIIVKNSSFRIIVGISILLMFLLVGACIFMPLPQAFRAYKADSITTTVDVIADIIELLTIPMIIAAYIGLFLIKKWGRLLFAISIGVMVGSDLFSGPAIVASAVNFFSDLFEISAGIILAIAYLSPLFYEE